MQFVPLSSLAAALMVPLMGISLALGPQDDAPQSTMQDQSLGIPLKGPAPVDVFHPGRNQ